MLLKVFGIALFFTMIFTSIGLVIGSLFGIQAALLLGAIFFLVALLLDVITYWYAPSLILRRYKAKPSTNKEINEIVEKMAIGGKIPVPKACIVPMDVPNSFATGRGEKAAICVTEGLLSLNRGEIEGVVAHGVWHIKDGNTSVQDFACALAHILHYTVVLTPLAVLILKFSLNPTREYFADYYGSRFSRKPRDLAAALGKMSETARQNPLRGSPAFEGIWVIDPFKREGLPRWFSTDPPTARRVKRLEDMMHEGIPEPPDATEVD
jgi:heat shock protein HtpX